MIDNIDELRLQVEIDAFGVNGEFNYDTEDVTHDNHRRAGFAAKALLGYADQHGNEGETIQTVLSDLLGDLMHLADAVSLDFGALVAQAERHYVAELEGVL